MEPKHDLMNSATSYAIGCASIYFGWICNMADLVQAIALFFGCIIVFIRLVHDAIGLARFIKAGK